MKKAIQIFIKLGLLLLCNSVLAQYPVLSTTSMLNPSSDINFLKKGNFAVDTNNKREQYVVFWRYNENGILFELKIEKVDKFLSKYESQGQLLSYNFRDAVILKYRLVKNGVVIYDNLHAPIEKHTSIGTKQGTSSSLDGLFTDFTRNVAASFYVERLPGNVAKINFFLNRLHCIRLNPDEYYEDGLPLFNVPVGGIEMIKVN